MPCDTRLRSGQTISQRKEEIRKTTAQLAADVAAGRVKPKIGPQGAIAFEGWTEQDRNGISDACAYRQIMVGGSALAKAKIAQAEQLSGRSVSKQALAHGHHSHDGGKTWHHGH